MIEAVALGISLAVGLGFAIREHRRSQDQPRYRPRPSTPPRPEGPPLSRAQQDEAVADMAAMALPAAILTPDPAARVAPGGNRLGGPAFLEAGEAWPELGCKPALFLAQLDFADLPPLPDFPTAGLLQFFISDDEMHGLDERPQHTLIAARWRPSGLVSPVAHHAVIAPAGLETTPLSDKTARDGVALVATPGNMPPGLSNWQAQELLDPLIDRPGFDALETELELMESDQPPHHIGGHPVFVQSDVRTGRTLREYDRTLLHLCSDDHVQWGDWGEANILIRREDLLARRFDRLLFTWDCS